MGSRKKKLSNFFSPATKALPTTPLELSGHIFLRTFFSRASKKTFSFLSDQTLTPPPLLVAGPLRTDLFAASLTRYGNHLLNKPWPAWQLCIQEVLSIKTFNSIFSFPPLVLLANYFVPYWPIISSMTGLPSTHVLNYD